MINGLKLEMEFGALGAGWTDTTADVITLPADQPPTLSYGIPGVSPRDRVAQTGTLTFTLQNFNPVGYYSLEHASKRAGFNLGIRVRASYLIGATRYYKFIGRLSVIAPTAGITPKLVRCTAVDWMDSAARSKQTTLAMQTSQRADQLITTLVAAITDQPVSATYDTGSETYVLAVDQSLQGLSELSKIADSEFGYIYIRGDTTGGGNLRFENRTNRLLAGAAVATFVSTDIRALDIPYDEASILNVVRAVTHPRMQDAAATTVLFVLQSIPLVPFGRDLLLSGNYTDPNSSQRAIKVAGKDMVVPVANTDYKMNTASDGSGTDLTALFTVTAVYTGSTVFYAFTNNSTQDGYITLLQARGRGVYDFQPVESKVLSQASIDAYGQQDVSIDMPYQSDAAVGQAVASFVASRWSLPIGAATLKLQCVAATSALLTQVIAREPGDRISITETQTGVSITAIINHVRIIFAPTPRSEWVVYRAEPLAYWNLEVVGYSELGTTTRLAPL